MSNFINCIKTKTFCHAFKHLYLCRYKPSGKENTSNVFKENDVSSSETNIILLLFPVYKILYHFIEFYWAKLRLDFCPHTDSPGVGLKCKYKS